MEFLKRLFGGRFDPAAAANRAAVAWKQALGPDLVGVVAFGSWATGEFVEEHSDLNLVVVARRLDTEVLRRLAAARSKAEGPRVRALYFSQAELKRFAEAFPLEFGDMAETRKVLAGEDPFQRLEVPGDLLALELLTESRNRLMKFRSAMVKGVGQDPVAAQALCGATIGSLLPLMRGLLRLKKRRPPRQRVRVIEEACRLFRLSRRTLLQAHDIRYGRKNAARIDAAGLLERLREELERVTEICAKAHEDGEAPEPAREGGRDREHGGRDREHGGRDREHGRRDRDHRDRDRRPSGGGDRSKRLAEVRALMAEAGQKKRWEPKEAERFTADEISRDPALSLGARFAWDRAWQPDRRKKGIAPPKPVEAEPTPLSPEEAWADEAAEITAQAAAEEAAPEAAGAAAPAEAAGAAEGAGAPADAEGAWEEESLSEGPEAGASRQEKA